jgi:hypothetical protein
MKVSYPRNFPAGKNKNTKSKDQTLILLDVEDLELGAILAVAAEFFLSEHAGACCRFRVKNQDAPPFAPIPFRASANAFIPAPP